MQSIDLIQADSRDLTDPMSEKLEQQGPKATFEWLTELLDQQRPALRSSNSKLVAYTGCSEAIDWLASHVSSPVTTHWGEGAALLGVPWGKIKEWLSSDKSHKIMALDTLYAYRLPAPNMSPFAQIAAPVLFDAPSFQELESILDTVMEDDGNPRMCQTIDRIMNHSTEILSKRERGVSVQDLPKLFLDPESFQNSSKILKRHDKIVSGIRKSINKIIKGARS